MKNINRVNALQKHKASDKIKWILTFTLIIILIIGTTGLFVVTLSPTLDDNHHYDLPNNDSIASGSNIVSNNGLYLRPDNCLDVVYLIYTPGLSDDYISSSDINLFSIINDMDLLNQYHMYGIGCSIPIKFIIQNNDIILTSKLYCTNSESQIVDFNGLNINYDSDLNVLYVNFEDDFMTSFMENGTIKNIFIEVSNNLNDFKQTITIYSL